MTGRPEPREDTAGPLEPREESGQLPEEAPPEQVPKKQPGTVREEAMRNAGGAGDEGRATGHHSEREKD